MTAELEAFRLVLLRRPADAPTYDEDALDRLQAEHLAFYDDLRARGLVATYGPVREQPDPALRGLAFFRVPTVEEALVLASGDPMVHARWLELEGMTFLARPQE